MGDVALTTYNTNTKSAFEQPVPSKTNRCSLHQGVEHVLLNVPDVHSWRGLINTATLSVHIFYSMYVCMHACMYTDTYNVC